MLRNGSGIGNHIYCATSLFKVYLAMSRFLFPPILPPTFSGAVPFQAILSLPDKVEFNVSNVWAAHRIVNSKASPSATTYELSDCK